MNLKQHCVGVLDLYRLPGGNLCALSSLTWSSLISSCRIVRIQDSVNLLGFVPYSFFWKPTLSQIFAWPLFSKSWSFSDSSFIVFSKTSNVSVHLNLRRGGLQYKKCLFTQSTNIDIVKHLL